MVSPGTGLFAPVARELVASRNLASAPGGQDSTTSRPQQPRSSGATVHVHRKPASTYRDDAYVPLHEAGSRQINMISDKTKPEYFLFEGWTGRVVLKLQQNFAFCRTSNVEQSADRERGRAVRLTQLNTRHYFSGYPRSAQERSFCKRFSMIANPWLGCANPSMKAQK
jgi:hypothetical protein